MVRQVEYDQARWDAADDEGKKKLQAEYAARKARAVGQSAPSGRAQREAQERLKNAG